MNFKKRIFQLKLRHILRKTNDLKRLKNIESLNVKELRELNFNKRKIIVSYAYENIPFYKELYDKHNFNPNSLLEEGDWSKVPVISKEMLKKNTQSIINPNFDQSRLRLSVTGGSTGVPLKVYFDKKTPLELFGWRTLSWWGVRPWENQAYIYRNVRKGFGEIINKAMWWPTQRVLLDCSSMGNRDMEVFVKQINKIKPAF